MKGSLVWTPEGQTSCFKEGYQWRQFILSLPRNLVCDGILSSYIGRRVVHEERIYYDEDGLVAVRQKIEKDRIMVCTDTDEAAFMNSGTYNGHFKGSSENVGCPEGFTMKQCEYGMKVYALRDINAGEEILCNYGDYTVDHGWNSMGL